MSLRIGELPSTLQRQMRAQSDSIPPGGANPGVSGVVNGVHGGAANGTKSTAAAVQNGTNGHFDLESPTGSVISGEKSKLGLLKVLTQLMLIDVGLIEMMMEITDERGGMVVDY